MTWSDARHDCADRHRRLAAAVGLPPPDLPDFELREELGRGGMGVVYRAWQKSLQREVAVKLILRGELATADEVARFQAEATAAGRLQHPQIVPIYEVGERRRPLLFRDAASRRHDACRSIGRGAARGARGGAVATDEVARAIDYAHASGSDSPRSEAGEHFARPRGEPHVTDFGLAKLLTASNNLTRTGSVLGTPAYMAPELASGEPRLRRSGERHL